MKRHRWLRTIATSVLVVLVVFVVLLGVLLATPLGTSLAHSVAQRYLPSSIQIEGVSGTFLGGLAIDVIRIEQAQSTVVVRELFVKVAPSALLSPTDIQVRTLSVSSIDLMQRGEPPEKVEAVSFDLPATPVVRLPIAVRLDDLRVGPVRRVVEGSDTVLLKSIAATGGMNGHDIAVTDLVVMLPGIAIRGTVNLSLVANPTVATQLSWTATTNADDAVTGQLRVNGSRTELKVSHELLTPFQLRTSGDMSAPVNAPPVVSLITRGDNMDLPPGRAATRIGEILLRLDGTPESWRVVTAGSVDTALVDAVPFRLNAEGSLSGLSDIQASLGDSRSGVATVRGDLSWAEALGFDLGIDLASFQPALFVDLDGNIDATLQLQTHDAAAGQFNGRLSNVSGTLFGVPLNADGRFTSTSFEDAQGTLSASVGTDRIQSRWSVSSGQTIDATVDAMVADLSRYHAELGGRASVEGVVAGTFDDPSVALALDAQALTMGKQNIDAFTASIRGSASDHELSLASTSRSLGEVRVSASGAFADDRWQGDITELALRSALTIPAMNATSFALIAPTAVTASASSVQLADMCLAAFADGSESTERGRLCLDGGFADDQINAMATANAIPILYAPVPAVSLTGNAQMRADVSGVISNPAATVQLVLEDASIVDRSQGDETTTAFTAFEVVADLQDRNLIVTPDVRFDQQLLVAGEVRVAACCDATAALGGTLTLVANEVQALNAFQNLARFDAGTAQLLLQPSGTLGAPTALVALDVEGGKFELAPTGVEYHDVALRARSTSAQQIDWTASALAETGSLSINGSAILGGATGVQVDADVTMRDATLLKLPDLAARASADLQLGWSPTDTVISGAVRFDEASLTIAQLPEDSVALSSDIRQQGNSADASSRTTLDLDVDLGQNTTLAGFGLQATVSGELSLQQEPTTPLSGYGTVSLSEATYVAYGQTLSVTRGQLRFSGPLESPSLDIRAQREVDEQVVGVDIAGTPDDLRSSLFATPDLADAETLSVLLTGRRLSSASESEGNALSDAAITLGLRQAFGVSAAIRDAVGLDTLTIDGGGRDGRLLAGKQISEDLYLQYAYGVFDQISSVLLRWQLNRRLALESTSGETQSVDLVYQVGDPSR